MTSAKPLNLAISLNLSSSSSSSSIHSHSNPAPPLDWHKKWFRQHPHHPQHHLQSHPQSSTSTSTPSDSDSDSDSSSSSSSSSSSDPWQQEPGSRKGKRRKWVTCLSDWNQGKGKETSDHLPHISISSSSSPTREPDEIINRPITSDDRRARLGGRPGGRIALGLADGTVWLLASQNASHNGKGKGKDDSLDQDLSEKLDREIHLNSNYPTPPSINTSHSPNRSSRAHSPTPSTHSNSRVSSSNHHRRTGESLSISSHAPPFVGFGSPVSPTAPTSSTSQSTNFNQIFNESTSTNNNHGYGELSISNGSGRDTPETSNITAIAENNSDGNSKMKDAETQLEAQYHAGDKDRDRESGHEAGGVGMVGGMMQALGLGHPNSTQQHSHSHSRNHENGNLSPNRSSYSQPHSTTKERERSNSERKYLDSTTESGRRSSLNPSPNLTRSHSSTNSILQSSEVSSSSNEFTPIFQFFTSDRSSVVGISILNSTSRGSSSEEESTLERSDKENGDETQDQQREPSNMIVLQESGTLSNWSLEDGNLISSLNLSNVDLYQEEKSSLSTASFLAGSGNLLSVPSTSNGQGAIASTIAALRSTANATPLGGRSRSGSDAAANPKDPKQSNSTSGNRSTSSKSGGSTATKFVNLEKLSVRRKFQDSDAVVDVEEEVGLLLAFDSLNSRICLLKVDTRPRNEDPPRLIKSIRLENPKFNVFPSGSISKSNEGRLQLRVLYIDSSDHLQSITVPITFSLQDQERDEMKSQSSNPTSFASHLNSKLTTQSLNSSPKIKPTSLSSEVPPSSSSRPTTPSVTSSDRRFDFHLPFQKNSSVDKQIPLVSQEIETVQIRDLGKIDKVFRIGKVLGFEVDEKNELAWIWSKKKLLVARLLEESFEKVAIATSDFSRLISMEFLGGDGKKVLLQFDDSIRIATLTTDSSIVINDFSDSSCVEACSGSDRNDSYWVSSEAGVLKIWSKDTVEQTKSSVVYQSSSSLSEERKSVTQEEVSVVSVLPLSLERVVVALSTGQLVLSPLLDLVTQRTYQKEIVSPHSEFKAENSSKYQGTISLLQLVTNVRTSSKHIVGGTEEGDLMIWDSTTLNLQAEWSLFTSPVTTLVPFGPTDNAIRLHGCVLVISSDGTVAIIVLDGLKLLSMIPGRGNGTGSRLEKVAVRADDLLLIYDDEKARVWDTRSQELRRSIGLDQALSLLEDGKGSWSQFQVDPTVSKREKGSSGVLSVIPSARGFSSTTVLADMRRAIEAASKAVHPSIPSGSVRGAPSNQSVQVEDSLAPPPPDAFMTIGRNAINSSNRSKASPAGAKKAFTILKPLLSALLPSCSLTSTSQENVTRLIGIDSTGSIPSFGTFSSPGFLARAVVSAPSDIWSISTSMTTDLLLSMVSMLGVISHIQEFENGATSIIAFLVIDLPEVIGEVYQPASLPTLASYFMDSNVEIQHASRALFASALDRLSQTEIDTLCEAWHDSLPSKSTSPEETRPLALSLLGLIAAERYKMLSPALLKDIASSISLYIDDENRPMHQALAIELCCRGFSTWQHYLDAMEVVRSLFALSTSKESGAIAENRALARQATLQIAADNTPLFMTTLSLDILHARSPAHCSATMRLVAFMVRRKPLILYPNLPRLAEAVVKSLDPTNTVFRESVVQAATVMISELVSCYPSIAFHGKLQRLAVGTHEGAIIMYDLKTATRLYVLEGHRNSLSGLEFSGDGRRLVSISLEESRALIWKVGNSFTGLFNPGIMPRQGGSDPSGAYKAIDFNIGEAGSLSPSEALEAVSFEWQNDRSVKLNVGQASMNFNVA